MTTSRTDTEARHRDFVATILKTRRVWGLRCEDGWAISASNEYEGVDVMPFWSYRGGARAVAKEEWSHYEVAEIDLDSFIGDWLRGLNENGILVGTNWTPDLQGKEIEPYDLGVVLDTRDV